MLRNSIVFLLNVYEIFTPRLHIKLHKLVSINILFKDNIHIISHRIIESAKFINVVSAGYE